MNKPELNKDWKKILKKAWSVRLIVLAGLLSALEVVLPLYVDYFSQGDFAKLSFIATAGALIARLIAQKEFKNEDDKE